MFFSSLFRLTLCLPVFGKASFFLRALFICMWLRESSSLQEEPLLPSELALCPRC